MSPYQEARMHNFPWGEEGFDIPGLQRNATVSLNIVIEASTQTFVFAWALWVKKTSPI